MTTGTMVLSSASQNAYRVAFVGDFKAFPLGRAAFLIKGDVLEEPADHEPQERRQQRIARDAAQEEPCGESEDVVIPFRVAVAEPVGARVPPDEVQAVGPQRQQGFAVGLRVAPILLERFVHDVSVG